MVKGIDQKPCYFKRTISIEKNTVKFDSLWENEYMPSRCCCSNTNIARSYTFRRHVTPKYKQIICLKAI